MSAAGTVGMLIEEGEALDQQGEKEQAIYAFGMKPIYPIMAIVVATFLTMGVALPVLPLHINHVLGLGPFVVGVAIGTQFVAALLTRFWVGRLSDIKGPRYAVLLGLGLAMASGTAYLISIQFLSRPHLAVLVLLGGRILMGAAESLIITACLVWSLGLTPPRLAGRSMGWTGMAMFIGLAIGAALGNVVFLGSSFTGIALLTIAIPLVCIFGVLRMRPLMPSPSRPQPVRSVLALVAIPSIGFAMSGISLGVITSFFTLYFAFEEWNGGALGYSAFATAIIAVRVFGGSFPDRYGGGTVARYSLVVQVIGMVMIAAAPCASWALVGAIVTGAGFSLVYPSLGLVAIQNIPPESRGVAMAFYTASLDLTLGLGGPAFGLIAELNGLRSVFFAGAASALFAILIVRRL
ncbi:MFS transporter [Parasphingorhabdus sp.]|uniref:MFS transporter n=1 Tax=Parasphingorhabdus sp. TaxID=2709688 RepID=UPI003BB1D5D1